MSVLQGGEVQQQPFDYVHPHPQMEHLPIRSYGCRSLKGNTESLLVSVATRLREMEIEPRELYMGTFYTVVLCFNGKVGCFLYVVVNEAKCEVYACDKTTHVQQGTGLLTKFMTTSMDVSSNARFKFAVFNNNGFALHLDGSPSVISNNVFCDANPHSG